VLNLAGLVNVSHVGTRMHDTIIACVPAPKAETGAKIAKTALADLAARERGDREPRLLDMPQPLSAADLRLFEQSSTLDDTSSEELRPIVFANVADARPRYDYQRIPSSGDEPDEWVGETPPPASSSSDSPSSAEEGFVDLEGSPSSRRQTPTTPPRWADRPIPRTALRLLRGDRAEEGAKQKGHVTEQ